MSSRSYVLVRNTAAAVGEPVRVDERGADGFLHTVSITSSAFRGRVSIEATLIPTPTEADWFKVPLNGQITINYPREGNAPETSTVGFTFRGRFVWLRARVEHEVDQPESAPAIGTIDRILLNF